MLLLLNEPSATFPNWGFSPWPGRVRARRPPRHSERSRPNSSSAFRSCERVGPADVRNLSSSRHSSPVIPSESLFALCRLFCRGTACRARRCAAGRLQGHASARPSFALLIFFLDDTIGSPVYFFCKELRPDLVGAFSFLVAQTSVCAFARLSSASQL
jgi:hypothetical protein